MIKKFFALLGLVPGLFLLIIGSYNAGITLLAQFFSDFVDLSNFSLANFFNPFTSAGGSGSFLDSLVAGPGASGGSAIRYWLFMLYALIAAAGFTVINLCWEILTAERKNKKHE
jgi:hypothetical protein